MRKLNFSFALLLLFQTLQQAQACEPMNAEQLTERIKSTGAKDLVFFASWCSGCQVHIREAKLEQTLFIAVFDELDRARQALESLLGAKAQKLCIWDKDGSLAQTYAVKSLPDQRKLP
ncbi:MAG: hypothetical protein NTX25_08995 [Proteobacteria bacterium]|nr:hypothetical protein [Pseudomonadota bacterium]